MALEARIESSRSQNRSAPGRKSIHIFAEIGYYSAIVEIHKELGSIRKDLRNDIKLDVAFAQIQMGQAQRAYDLIRQIFPESIENRSERLRFAVHQAEALRNLTDRAKHQESIEVLDKASQDLPTKTWSVSEKRW